MPVTITRLSKAELEKEFKRPGVSAENLADYIDTLRDLSVGDGFTVRVSEATRTTNKKLEDGTVEAKEETVEVVPDSGDGENVDTMRAFKRRMTAAADTLGFSIKWKPKGHRAGEGEDAHFVTDWLVARIRESKVETTKNGQSK